MSEARALSPEDHRARWVAHLVGGALIPVGFVLATTALRVPAGVAAEDASEAQVLEAV